MYFLESIFTLRFFSHSFLGYYKKARNILQDSSKKYLGHVFIYTNLRFLETCRMEELQLVNYNIHDHQYQYYVEGRQ